MTRATTVGDLLQATEQRLRAAGIADATVDAEWLLAHLLGGGRNDVRLRRDEAAGKRLQETLEPLVRRRCAREPLQYVLGVQEFHGLEFAVDRRVLVPRPETETLVDVALGLDLPDDCAGLDLGTGSGCIPVALMFRRPGWRFVALDRSSGALAIARRNVARHGLAGRIELRLGDLGDLPQVVRNLRFDLVVSNPPYVGETDWRALQPEVRDHEPKGALVGGARGTEEFPRIADGARSVLRPGGWLAVEVGHGQAAEVAGILSARGFDPPSAVADLAGVPRVVVARRPSPSSAAPGA